MSWSFRDTSDEDYMEMVASPYEGDIEASRREAKNISHDNEFGTANLYVNQKALLIWLSKPNNNLKAYGYTGRKRTVGYKAVYKNDVEKSRVDKRTFAKLEANGLISCLGGPINEGFYFWELSDEGRKLVTTYDN